MTTNTGRNHRPASERRHSRPGAKNDELQFDELSLDPDQDGGWLDDEPGKDPGIEEIDLSAGKSGSRRGRTEGEKARAKGQRKASEGLPYEDRAARTV